MSFRVSHSKRETWNRCKFAYHKKYVEKLRKKFKPRPLLFGSIVHEMLEEHQSGRDAFKVLASYARKEAKIIRIHREEYGDIIEDIDCIVSEYFEHYDNDGLQYLKVGKSYAEHEFEIEIVPDIIFNGKIDGKALTKNKMRWLVERKTFGRMPDENMRWRSVQSALYSRAAQIMGWEFDGTLWDYIWSKPPLRPQRLKSGKLAKRSINTLPSRVLDTIQAYKLNPKDYAHLVKSATKNRERYFQRKFSPTKRRVVDMVIADFVETAREMRDSHGRKKARSIGRHCDWCEFEPICRAELTGGDVDFIQERDYVKREERHEVQAE
jgi:hypothetical protein